MFIKAHRHINLYSTLTFHTFWGLLFLELRKYTLIVSITLTLGMASLILEPLVSVVSFGYD